MCGPWSLCRLTVDLACARHVHRIRVGRMRAERRRIAALRESSALRIQRLYRGHRARKRVRAKRREKTSRLEVALWGQKHWRGLTTRKAFEEILQVRKGTGLLA